MEYNGAVECNQYEHGTEKDVSRLLMVGFVRRYSG